MTFLGYLCLCFYKCTNRWGKALGNPQWIWWRRKDLSLCLSHAFAGHMERQLHAVAACGAAAACSNRTHGVAALNQCCFNVDKTRLVMAQQQTNIGSLSLAAFSANTRRWANAGIKLGQRRRWWANILYICIALLCGWRFFSAVAKNYLHPFIMA